MSGVEHILAVLAARGLRLLMRPDGRLALAGPKSTLPLRTGPLRVAVLEHRAEIVAALGLAPTVAPSAGTPVELLTATGAVIPGPEGWRPEDGSPGMTCATYWRRQGDVGWAVIPCRGVPAQTQEEQLHGA